MSSTGRNLPAHPVNGLGAYDTPPELCAAVVQRLIQECPRDWRPGVRLLEPSVGSGNWPRVVRAALPRVPVKVEVIDVDPLAPGLELARAAGDVVTLSGDPARRLELAERWRHRLERDGVPRWRQGSVVEGFLVTEPRHRPRWILGNPPYSVTTPAMACAPCGGTGTEPGARPGTRRKCQICCTGKDAIPGQVRDLVIGTADYHVDRALEVSERHVVFVLRLPFLEGQARFDALFRDQVERLATARPLRAVWTCPRRASFAFGGTDSVATAVFWWDRDWPHPWYQGGWLPW